MLKLRRGTMKTFISLPMAGLTTDEIRDRMDKIKNLVNNDFKDAVILDSLFDDFESAGKPPLWFLGKSLTLMSEADLVVFGPGWEKARGCKAEHHCAVEYGIDRLYLNLQDIA